MLERARDKNRADSAFFLYSPAASVSDVVSAIRTRLYTVPVHIYNIVIHVRISKGNGYNMEKMKVKKKCKNNRNNNNI